jgi:hypothetical protein
MAPRFSVTVARRCDQRVKALRGEAKKGFDRVVEELRHRGCEAGGIRMRADTGADHRVCERRFYRAWRMHMVFGDEENIVISWVGQHDEDEDVHTQGARGIPGLSGVGRARDEQPECCDDLADPPADPDLVDLVNQIRPTRRQRRSFRASVEQEGVARRLR